MHLLYHYSHFVKAPWKSSQVKVSTTLVIAFFIFSLFSKRMTLRFSYSFGNNQKSQGADFRDSVCCFTFISHIYFDTVVLLLYISYLNNSKWFVYISSCSNVNSSTHDFSLVLVSPYIIHFDPLQFHYSGLLFLFLQLSFFSLFLQCSYLAVSFFTQWSLNCLGNDRD